MASLAEREGLRGKVQCIYFDPPYGIKFNSNFQWSTTSRDVKDGNASHITREPEQVKAFRDTWRDGIHSYLTYLRDRLTVARDLLTDSGSIFVQIGDENVHRVRAVMDEVFERCILMATDPGDLVLDPTCGSGTTAYVAEQWGRRWITIDTSRVALALARARIMGARYPTTCSPTAAKGQLQGSRGHARRRHPGANTTGARQHPPGFVYERVPAHHAEVDRQQRRDRRHLGHLAEEARSHRASRSTRRSSRRGRSGRSPRGRREVARRHEEAARRMVAGAHRAAEGDRRLHRRQGRVRVPLRQALRRQEEGPRRRPVHGRKPLAAPRAGCGRERRTDRRRSPKPKADYERRAQTSPR
jgi:hypothetical protein